MDFESVVVQHYLSAFIVSISNFVILIFDFKNHGNNSEARWFAFQKTFANFTEIRSHYTENDWFAKVKLPDVKWSSRG